jgi:ABC-type transport system substrate-binding protein
MKKLSFPCLLSAALLVLNTMSTLSAAAEPKVLRYAFRVAETGFDPVQVTDLYSRIVVAGIFEAPLQFDYLARPFKLRPATTTGMPEVSADFKTLTLHIKPGIYFSDDPAFKGKKRELVAEDYVYSIKRHYDPFWKSGNLYLLENAKLLGLSELRREVLKSKKPFNYDRPVEGVRALDRYTLQIKLGVPDPRFIYQLSDTGYLGAVAREVVEFYGDKIMAHPVGTNAWKLAEWRRSSRIVLDKNPNYRDVFYDETPPADADPRLIAEALSLKGRKLPMIDRVEIAIIEENQPRWLSFLNGEADMIEEVPNDFASIVIPNNKLAPNLVKKGIRMVRYPRADVSFSYFNMDDPTVGGYTADKVALRRAISLGLDMEKQVRLARRGQAVIAQGPIPPGVFGFDPAFKSELSDYSPARARALLDLFGYVDRDGDGWRDMPDGSPLTLQYATQPDGQSRQLVELWQKDMAALNIRIEFKVAKWPENLKSANAGKLMMWGVGWVATSPDGDTFLALGSDRSKGQANKPRFDLPAFNALYDQQNALPDGPERMALMTAAQKLLIAYMPYKLEVHRVYTDLTQPWVIGFNRNIFLRDYWKYVDIDTDALTKQNSQ